MVPVHINLILVEDGEVLQVSVPVKWGPVTKCYYPLESDVGPPIKQQVLIVAVVFEWKHVAHGP